MVERSVRNAQVRVLDRVASVALENRASHLNLFFASAQCDQDWQYPASAALSRFRQESEAVELRSDSVPFFSRESVEMIWAVWHASLRLRLLGVQRPFSRIAMQFVQLRR